MQILKEYTEKMKILREYRDFEYDKKLLEFHKTNTGVYKMKGVFQQADVLNQNGRIYERQTLETEIKNYQKAIRERTALSELDHPDSSIVELKNVSHLITELYMDNDGVVYGELEVLDTPSGRIAKTLVDSGCRIGISSRGIGETQREGDHDVVKQYALIAFDLVQSPSVAAAILVKESRNLTKEEFKKVFTKTYKIDRVLNDIL